MIFIEDYIDTVESLSPNLQRLISHLRELDACVYHAHAELMADMTAFCASVHSLSREERVAKLQSIEARMRETSELDQERALVAMAAKELVNVHVGRANDNYAAFCEELAIEEATIERKRAAPEPAAAHSGNDATASPAKKRAKRDENASSAGQTAASNSARGAGAPAARAGAAASASGSRGSGSAAGSTKYAAPPAGKSSTSSAQGQSGKSSAAKDTGSSGATSRSSAERTGSVGASSSASAAALAASASASGSSAGRTGRGGGGAGRGRRGTGSAAADGDAGAGNNSGSETPTTSGANRRGGYETGAATTGRNRVAGSTASGAAPSSPAVGAADEDSDVGGAASPASAMAVHSDPAVGDSGAGEHEGEEEEEEYCYCRKGTWVGDMVGCDSEGCKYEWFHLQCVGLKKAPPEGEQWICPDCTQRQAAEAAEAAAAAAAAKSGRRTRGRNNN
ncbi:hypothetical protein H9P43_002781 [Blastocladiella emersonii ATCC 22665]|nr:hypothetical protein H9P43_002781 [Blastocladiella emersonii ATCC 22665]